MKKRVLIHYFALLREQRGKSKEWFKTEAETLGDLYAELKKKHGFTLEAEQLKVALNADFAEMNSVFEAKDTIAFIPPVAGG